MDKQPIIEATDLPNWLYCALLAAQTRPKPDEFIRHEAKLARATWAKDADQLTRTILKTIMKAKKAGKVLRDCLNESSFQSE